MSKVSKGRKEGIIVISDGKAGGISEIFPKDDKNELRESEAKSHGKIVLDCEIKEKRGCSKGKACK